MSKQAGPLHELVALSPSPRFMPPDWKPPAPAWSASFTQQTTPVVMAYFGTQFGASDREQHPSLMQEFLLSADAPDNIESASFIDRSAQRNLISSAYWTDPAR